MKKVNTCIKGLDGFFDEDYDESIFYNADMLEHGFCIVASEGLAPTDNGLRHEMIIMLYYSTKEDMGVITIYEGPLLEGILTRMIFRDLFELFNEDPTEFLQVANELANAHMAHSIQTDKARARQLTELIDHAFLRIMQFQQSA